MARTIIKARDVVKEYESSDLSIKALNGISLEIKEGEMVTVMGPSGCGKTTLLNCLSGLDSINSGTIEIDGRKISEMDNIEKSAYRAKNIGFVFQFYNLLPVLSARENVELPLLLTRVRPQEARRAALEMLDKVGLLDWQNHKPSQLSGGQRQRVTIARSLVNNPTIVFADEPTGDLDSKSSDAIMELLTELNRCEGTTFLIVTHDSKIADNALRTIIMRDGQIEEDARNEGYSFECPEAYTDEKFGGTEFKTRKSGERGRSARRWR